MEKYVSGSCFCGKLKFHYDLPSKYSAHCHCDDCRRAHGSAYVTWVGINAEQFHLDESETLKWHGTLETGRRGFCVECGSTLFFESKAWAGDMAVTRASIEGQIDIQPGAHAFYEFHVDWMPTINDELVKLSRQDILGDNQ
jgi:hypothetical protein